MIFSFLATFHFLEWTFLNFQTFSVFLPIFHVLKFVFLIFLVFKFSFHIPGLSFCISHFSRFLVISSFFKKSSASLSLRMKFIFIYICNIFMCMSYITCFLWHVETEKKIWNKIIRRGEVRVEKWGDGKCRIRECIKIVKCVPLILITTDNYR